MVKKRVRIEQQLVKGKARTAGGKRTYLPRTTERFSPNYWTHKKKGKPKKKKKGKGQKKQSTDRFRVGRKERSRKVESPAPIQ